MPTKVSKIPTTRIESWKQFRSSGRKRTIKNFILLILDETREALSCRMISDISGIEVQSLTRPIQELVKEKRISTDQKTKGVGSRDVIAYSIIQNIGQ